MNFIRDFWLNKFVKIRVFDDGNIPVSNKNNIWKVSDIHFNGDKIKLENINNPNYKIESISPWKVDIIKIYDSNKPE